MVDMKIGQRPQIQSHARGDAIAACERERVTTLKQGGVPTSFLQVITDKAGNLITTYPVKPR